MTGLFKKITVLALPLSLMISGISQAASLQNADAFWKSTGYSASTVSAMPWWESNTITSFGYQSLTSDARYGWDAVSNANIGYSKKSTEGEATLRFYATSDQYLDYYARCKQYDSSGVYIGGADLENPSKVFYKSNLVINDYLMKTLSTRTQSLDVILHEVGHSISLKHQDDDVASVMVGSRLTSYGAPTSLDKANVAWKY